MTSFAEQKLAELNSENLSSLLPLFHRSCSQEPGKIAFSCLGQSITYEQFSSYTAALASYYTNECGLEKGDRVAIQLPNLTQYPIAVWAAFRAGLIVVNTNPQYTAREQLHQFKDSGATTLVVLDALLPIGEAIYHQTSIDNIIVVSSAHGLALGNATYEKANYHCFNSALESGAKSTFQDADIAMSDTAVLQYTGGTTGPSKGAMLSHGNIFCAMTMSRASIKLIVAGEAEMPIVVLPLYHVFGFSSCVIGTTLHSGTSVLIPDPRNLDSIIHAMRDNPFTAMAGVNTLLQGLMSHPEFDAIDYSHLKGVVAGGTTLVKEIAEEWLQRTGTIVYEGYGLSETSSVATCNRVGSNQVGTVGLPMDHLEVKVADEQGRTVEVGERGEVCIRGANIMQGYWQQPEATAEAIDAEGWFRTGDVGVQTEQGRLKIVDRIKDMILVSGFNVYPNEIEAVVYSHPDITECAAIGIPSQQSGEAIKLYVVSSNKDLSAEQVIAYCRQELTAYKVPKQIVFAKDLPKSPAGKILRRELREL